MARFDVYRSDNGLLLDVQADSLPHLETRLVVPLFTADQAPRPSIATLNPEFDFEGRKLTMMTQYAAALPDRELGKLAGSLVTEDYAIGRALDMLLAGI